MTLNPYEVLRTTRAQTAAADRAEQIRLGLQSTAVLYARAVDEEDWRALGYSSVADWAAKEFGPDRFSTERRQEIVALLTASGYTVRQIAKATGAGKSTVARDQRSVPPGTPDDEPALSPRQQAAREREAVARARREREEAATYQREWDDSANAGTYDPTAAYEYDETGRLMGPKPVEPPLNPDRPAALVPASPYRITDADIEQIISEDLTRGQIQARFGVGEHAAQLARRTAVTIKGERSRVEPVNVGALRAMAEEYLSMADTGRAEITRFLDWLENMNA